MKLQNHMSVDLANLTSLATQLSNAMIGNNNLCVHFKGQMGAGKTTFIKEILRSYGVMGSVTSPTFSVVNEYSSEYGDVLHMDLYRIESFDDIESLGVVDMWNSYSMILIEWPEKDPGLLPDPDLVVSISINNELSRDFSFQPYSKLGQQTLNRMNLEV